MLPALLSCIEKKWFTIGVTWITLLLGTNALLFFSDLYKSFFWLWKLKAKNARGATIHNPHPHDTNHTSCPETLIGTRTSKNTLTRPNTPTMQALLTAFSRRTHSLHVSFLLFIVDFSFPPLHQVDGLCYSFNNHLLRTVTTVPYQYVSKLCLSSECGTRVHCLVREAERKYNLVLATTSNLTAH